MAEAEFIEGIYLYCDRWCERCPLTARCRVYAVEEAALARDAVPRDPQNADFWRSLEHALADAEQELRQLAPARIEVAPAEGTGGAAPHPLVAAAAEYAAAVDDWFAARRDLFAEKRDLLNQQQRLGLADADPRAAAARIADAVEVVRWYQRLIEARLAAAVEPEAEDGDTVEAEAPCPAGTAKVALIAIDRSISAWTLLRRELPATDDDSTLNLMLALARLRDATQRAVPQARAFQRPGFDAP